MHMVDGLDLGVPLDGHVVEARLCADLFERGIEAGQALHAGVAAHGFIVIQHHVAEVVDNGQDGAVEIAVCPGFRGPVLAFDGVRVAVFT